MITCLCCHVVIIHVTFFLLTLCGLSECYNYTVDGIIFIIIHSFLIKVSDFTECLWLSGERNP